MSQATLYQYAVLWHPNEKEVEDGVKSRVVVEPTTILAESEQGAVLSVGRAIPEAEVENIDQLEVLIRPF